MKNIVMHPSTKEFTLKFYFILYRRSDKVLVKHAQLQRASKATLKSQTSVWPELQELLLACREQIVNGKRFEKVAIKDLANKTPDQIVKAVTRALI